MRTVLYSLIAIGAICLAESRGQADTIITGSQAFASNATVSMPTANDVNETNFTMNFVTLLGGANQTNDYVGTFGSFTNTLDTTHAGSFSFGSSLYGMFNVSSVLENNLIPNTSRTLEFAGTFSPNSATFGPGFLPAPGMLTVTINEATIGGNSVLSASATMSTAPPVTAPNPSTLAMLASLGLPVGWVLLRRRRQRQTKAS
jgi:hypothetical protein